MSRPSCQTDRMAVRSLIRAAIILVVAALLLVALAYWGQRRLIYFPDRSAPPPAGTVLPGGRDVMLHTDDGLALSAWLIRPSPDIADRRIGVLVAHGNAGHRQGRHRLCVPSLPGPCRPAALHRKSCDSRWSAQCRPPCQPQRHRRRTLR